VKGLVGIAADPDFTTDVVLPKLDDATKVRPLLQSCCKLTFHERVVIHRMVVNSRGARESRLRVVRQPGADRPRLLLSEQQQL